MPADNDKFATKKGVERVLEVIAAYVKKWERYNRVLALQNKVLFESLSPEGQAKVRAAWDELDRAKDHEGRLKTLESARP